MKAYPSLPLILLAVVFHGVACTGPTMYERSPAERAAITAKRSEQIAIFEQRVRDLIRQGVLPIIDVEFHYDTRIQLSGLMKKMDENGVALVWLAPTGDAPASDDSLDAHARFPDRVVPTTVSGDGRLWHSGNWWFLKKLAADVRSGRFFAMGEFEGRHYHAGPSTSPDAHMPVDSNAMTVVFELSEETGVPFLLHHEAEDQLLPELERMLQRYPKAKVIWCHLGRNRNPNTWKRFQRAETVRDFLHAYPNLYFDLLESPPGARFSGYVEGIIYKSSPDGFTLDPEWKAVIEEFADRIMLGSDTAPLRFTRWYDRVFRDQRRLILQNVRRDVAEKIAYKNAWKLMTGEDWKDD